MRRLPTQLKILTPYAALLIRKGSEKTVVISDLHIGWEVALSEEGVHVPSQTSKLLERINNIILSEKPDCLLFLGDIKHTVAKIELEEWHDVPDFFEEVSRKVSEVKVILGNHDGNLEALLPENVKILPKRGTIIGDIGLFHGHTWPDVELLGCGTLVAGHVHPVVGFKDPIGFRITRQVWVRAPCDGNLLANFVLKRCGIKFSKGEKTEDFLKSNFNIDLKASSLLIMPSFNDFLGGQIVNLSNFARQKRFEEFIGPVLRSGSVNLWKAEVYLLDGTFLGFLDHLRKLS